MKNLILSATVVLTAISCEKKQSETFTQDTSIDSVLIPETNEPVESSTLQTCYVAVSGKDSVFISLEDNLGTFIGKMRYKNFEKDSSLGDISGTQNGDTLKLTYNFEAEGTTSEREIYFLRKDGNLIEGIGDHSVDGNTDSYANATKLTYNGHTLKPVDCTGFESKFKNQ